MNEDAPLVREQVEADLGMTLMSALRLGASQFFETWKLETAVGPLFLKNQRDRASESGALRAEAAGLSWLAETQAVATPQVRACGDDFLVLDWIDVGPETPSATCDEAFGRELAALHAFGAPKFGGPNNYVGPLRQQGVSEGRWSEFYWRFRLEPFLRDARVARHLDEDDRRDFATLARRLEDRVGPELRPARLHGDLWSGNRLVDASGKAWLIDPAVYGGHPEMDLAMMRLFGGFSSRVFDAYAESGSLPGGTAGRVPLWQLYPLLVHLRLFGGSYLAPLRRALKSQL